MLPETEEYDDDTNEEKHIILKDEFDWFPTKEFADLKEGDSNLLKEKCTPRARPIPLLTYGYTINKKLNF